MFVAPRQLQSKENLGNFFVHTPSRHEILVCYMAHKSCHVALLPSYNSGNLGDFRLYAFTQFYCFTINALKMYNVSAI